MNIFILLKYFEPQKHCFLTSFMLMRITLEYKRLKFKKRPFLGLIFDFQTYLLTLFLLLLLKLICF